MIFFPLLFRAVACLALACGVVFMAVGASDDGDFAFVPMCLRVSGVLWVYSASLVLAMVSFSDAEERPRAVASLLVLVVVVAALAFFMDNAPSVYGWFAIFWLISIVIVVNTADERLYDLAAPGVAAVAALISLGATCAAWGLDVDVLLDKPEDSVSVAFFALSSVLILPAAVIVYMALVLIRWGAECAWSGLVRLPRLCVGCVSGFFTCNFLFSSDEPSVTGGVAIE
jgi:hypothetical protein